MVHKHLKDKMYFHFGGHIELDETPWQAVVRELREEAGYDIRQLKVLQPKIRLKKLSNAVLHPLPVSYHSVPVYNTSYKHRHTDSMYAFVTDEEAKYMLSSEESADIKLLTREEIVSFPEGEMWDLAREICLFIFDEILPNWEQVPAIEFK